VRRSFDLKIATLLFFFAFVTSSQGSPGSEPVRAVVPATEVNGAPSAPSSELAPSELKSPTSPITNTTRQLIVVRTANWNASSGTLARYDRDESLVWHRTSDAISVNVGRHGLAWGRGLHEPPKTGRLKKEGDGRSPAGVFAIDQAFGAAKDLPEGANGFPYLQALPTSYCVEDLRSAYYNRIIDASEVSTSSWQQWSRLLRTDGQFQWGLVVRHNTPEIKLGAGSCVFLHVWRGPFQPTSGCTSMAQDQIEAMLLWLEPEARPVLVQLPEQEYRERRDAWGLP
jgi:L,D-peptidoglycan transpeptidase YkuD (ErfK/YbiS/YcfS/YnhG family)